MSSSFNGSALSDEALMAGAQDGDTAAFAELYDRHAGRAFRVAEAICHDTGRAEDALQEAFLAIWRCRAQFNPANGSFKAWSMRIIRNRAIDSRGQVACDQTDGMLGSLRKLPEAQAEVIALAYFGELSHTEIATQLNLPPGAVKGRMRLGLEKLRKQMGVVT
ncbi:MAG TPA: sigma-70 family RNA polymerase sigma factor [Solirubrobacterales bacterium]